MTNSTANHAHLNIDDLQKQCTQLENQNTQLEQQVVELTSKVRWFEEQFRLNRHRQFGVSSERTIPEQSQLFNEAEAETKPELPEPAIEEITYRRRKQAGQREFQLQDLPEEVIEYRLLPQEQTCACCGNSLHEMSTEVRLDLKIIPAQVKVVKHVRYVYSCRHCERKEITTPIVTAPMPSPVLPGSLVSPSLMSYVMTQKYCEGLPLYRQEQQWSRLGIDISRQTMANWMIQGANRHLKGIYDRMHEHLLTRDILHADETTLQVLHEPGRAAQSSSYLWLYRSGRDGPAIILYDYQTTRASKHPNRFLKGFKGWLQVDGYAGYNDLPDITLVGCWAHSRRKFTDALKALPDAQREKAVVAQEGLDFCNQLFAIERKLKDVSAQERYQVRLEQSTPILEAFLAWLKTQTPRVLPKSALGQAVHYCRNQWEKLNAFLQDGRLELDNNRSERSIKPFVIGRKNWLFSNTPRGATASAVIYSIIETAKENSLNPFTYLTYLFEQLPNSEVTDPAVLDALLPWSPTLPDICRVPNKA
jgi:transposase